MTRPTTSDAVRWLDGDEQRLWRGFVEVSGRVIQELDHTLKTDADMTFDDYEVLVHLSEAPERRLRMSDLSERLLHSKSRLTQRIDRLARRGWVRREKCDEDRRGTFACLTDNGHAAITAAAPGHVADVRRALLDHVEPDELETLRAVFDRVAAALRTD